MSSNHVQRLELFLVREVDYVVTDREDYPRAGGRNHQVPTPSPLPSFCSVSPATPTSPHDGLASKRTRSRAEAMLERVKHQPQIKNTGDILDNALTWRIPIYPLPRFINWLEKVAKKAEKLYDSGGRIVEKGVRELRGSYLKVETSARPEFRQFNSWPSIAVHRDNNNQQKNKNHSNEYQRMTRKIGKVAKEATSAPGGGGNGYCEVSAKPESETIYCVMTLTGLPLVILNMFNSDKKKIMCRIHYDNLDSHVATVEHLKLVTDPTQYCHLDSIIAQHNLGVTSVRKSLRIAKSPPPYLPPEMGGRQSSETTVNNHHPATTATSAVTTPQSNGHLTRSKTAASAGAIHNQFNGIDKKRSKTQTHSSTPETIPPAFPEHNLRPRRSLRAATPPKPQPATLPPPPPHKETSHTSQLPKTPTTPNQILIRPTLPPPRRTSRVIRKRLSVEEKLIEDNKSYYKVEVLNSKLRSTEYFISQNKLDNQSKLNGTVPGTVLLQQENNKTTTKTPEKAPVVVRFKKVRKTELAVLSDEAESFMFGEPKRPSAESSESSEDDDEDDEACGEDEDDSEVATSASSNVRKVERLDEDDVKPSLPVLQPPSSPVHRSQPPSSPPSLQQVKDEPEDQIERRITFSFDMAPLRDPWLETYKRQDEGTEMYIPQHHTYPSLLLPYQLPQEKHFKRLLGSGAFSATGVRRRDHRLSKLIDDRPRKSPRCHASTLAIMSSLMRRHRPGRDCDRTFTYEEDSSLASDIIESSSNSERFATQTQTIVPNTTAVQQAFLSAVLNPEGVDRIGEALLNGESELSMMEPCLAVDPKAITDGVSIVNVMNGLDMDINTLINTYQQCTSLEAGAFEQAPTRPFDSFRFGADSCASSDCSDLFGFLDDGRVVSKKRKRKRNMTGWPQPKRKVNSNSAVKDILADQPPVDVNQFECVKAAKADSQNSLSTTTSTTPLAKRRGRPPKNRPLQSATNSTDSPSSTTSQPPPPPPPPPPSLLSTLPIRRKVHKLFAHRRSYFK
uniref:DBF4-type domain-containing protein n=1 Tax=Rhodnius prolixus TaxID=13249 RepID=T1I136_RHOPR